MWPEPIFMRVVMFFLIEFFSRNDVKDFYDFWYPQ